MKSSILLFLKGVAMGAANVIPGVSGGTIAFITGIYEPFINSLKSFDLNALKLIFNFRLKEFANHVNLSFLSILVFGIGFSLLTIGKLLDYLFLEFPIYVWAFFFGLISISIISVGRSIKSWNKTSVFWFIVGTGFAIFLSLLNPASEDNSFLYLVICGVIAMASMILPGLSGSFVLILLGNYQLIMLKAVPGLEIEILIPVFIGVILGFVILSRAINFMLRKFHDPTLSVLTGFILGSLLIIWPWKNQILLKNEIGELVLKKGEPIVQGYHWLLPELTMETFIAFMFFTAGIFLVLFIEKFAEKSS